MQTWARGLETLENILTANNHFLQLTFSLQPPEGILILTCYTVFQRDYHNFPVNALEQKALSSLIKVNKAATLHMKDN